MFPAMEMPAHLIALVLGVVLGFFGGELLLRGTLGLARASGLMSRTIAGAIAGLATSSPEMSIAITSAIANEPEIAFGNNIGGNVVNIGLVVGLIAAATSVAVTRKSLTTSYGFVLAQPPIVAAMLLDGALSRLESALLMLLFCVWFYLSIRRAFEQPEEMHASAGWISFGQGATGLALLVAAGRLIVYGASHLARDFGLSDFAIGATVVALGTATPELGTFIISRLRGHHQLGLGMILGSTIVSGYFVIGLAGIIAPIHVDLREAAPALIATIALGLLSIPLASGVIPRWRGLALLIGYLIYVLTVAAEI